MLGYKQKIEIGDVSSFVHPLDLKSHSVLATTGIFIHVVENFAIERMIKYFFS
jgi:hypothetical protein